jgi:hypothetical protein
MSEAAPMEVLPSELWLAELERALRYRWLAALATGRSVLEVVPADVLAPFWPEEPGVRLGFAAVATPWRTGVHVPSSRVRALVDPRRLPLADGAAPVLACFDAIGRMAEPIGFLDEARRVVAADGLFVASTREPGDIRRLSEPAYPTELLLAHVERRFANIAVFEGHLGLVAIVAPEGARGGSASLAVPPMVAAPQSAVVIASDGPLPDAGHAATLDDGTLLHHWLAELDRVSALAHQAAAQLARARVEAEVGRQDAALLSAARPRAAVVRRLRRLAGAARRRWAAR